MDDSSIAVQLKNSVERLNPVNKKERCYRNNRSED